MSESVWNRPASPEIDASAGGKIDTRNYAGNQKVIDGAREMIWNQLGAMVAERETYTAKFSRWNSLADGKHTQRAYHSKTGLFINRLGQVLESHVDRMHNKTFPFQELFTVKPKRGDLIAEQRAEITKAVIEHVVDQSPIRTVMPLFLYEGLKLGTSVMKSYWDVRTTREYRRRATPGNRFLRRQRNQRTQFEEQVIRQYEGPRPKVVDLLRWYIHPVTAMDIDQYQIIFEDMDVDEGHLRGMAAAGEYSQDGIERMMKNKAQTSGRTSSGSGVLSQIQSSREDRLSHMGFHPRTEHIEDGIFQILEIWCRFPLFKFTGASKRDQGPIDCKMVLGFDGSGDPVPLAIKQNPFLTQRPPYRAWRVRQRMDSFYGRGQSETLEGLQIMLNAYYNMAIDSARFTIQQLVVIDTTKTPLEPEEIEFAPMAVIPVRGDVDKAIKFISPPPVYKDALQMASVIDQLISNQGQSQPINEGRVTGGVRSASHANILSQAASIFEDAAVEAVESQVLTPMLRDWYLMTEHWLSPDSFDKIVGGYEGGMDYQSLVGDYDLQWRVAQQAQRREAMDLQIMQLEVQMREAQLVLAQMGQQMGTPAAPPGPGGNNGGPTGVAPPVGG